MFGRRAVGGLLLSVDQRVGGLLGEARLLLVLVHVVLLHLRVVCPYFGHFGVLALVVLDGDRVRPVLLDGVLNLVQLLAHVVGGVVLRGGARVAARLPALAHAPVEGGQQAADPGHGQHGAQQRHQEICAAGRRRGPGEPPRGPPTRTTLPRRPPRRDRARPTSMLGGLSGY